MLCLYGCIVELLAAMQHMNQPQSPFDPKKQQQQPFPAPNNRSPGAHPPQQNRGRPFSEDVSRFNPPQQPQQPPHQPPAHLHPDQYGGMNNSMQHARSSPSLAGTIFNSNHLELL